MNILIIGPPGVGKGTQAKLITNELGIIHLSTGEILRKEIENQSKVGVEAKFYIDKGEFIPDITILKIIRRRIACSDCLNGYILDGFPRTLPQAVGLDKIMKKLKHNLDISISLVADEKVLEKRLIERSLKYNRSDDMPTIIKKRQQIYWIQTAPLLKFYKSKGILKEINGLGEIHEITTSILNLLK